MGTYRTLEQVHITVTFDKMKSDDDFTWITWSDVSGFYCQPGGVTYTERQQIAAKLRDMATKLEKQ